MTKPCVHKWQIDSQNVGTCSLCGEVRQFPMEKDGQVVVLKPGRPPAKRGRPKRNRTWTGIREKNQYYEAHKEEIARDLLSIGRSATREKWGIPTSTITSLERRWLTEAQRAQIETYGPAGSPLRPSPSSPSRNGPLPPFPEFSGTWDPDVQLRWLEVYQTLAAGAGKPQNP
jgi:hypothetical protein